MPRFINFQEMRRERRDREIDQAYKDSKANGMDAKGFFGSFIASRIKVNAMTPLKLYAPLQKRLAQVLNNLNSSGDSTSDAANTAAPGVGQNKIVTAEVKGGV